MGESLAHKAILCCFRYAVVPRSEEEEEKGAGFTCLCMC